MKLQDYFVSQRNISLEPAHKVELYENITHRIHAPVSIFARMSFYTKLSLYTVVGLFFLASLYLPYFSSLFQKTDGVLRSSLGGATVQADYIAQIIETKGDIAIYNNGEKVESTLFKAGDRLVLPAGAEIVFHVTTIAQAKVTGPAEFFVEKNDQGYTIQLINGQYAEVQSLAESDEAQGLSVQSSRLSIRPKQSKKVHYTYTEQGENAIIDNQGETELLVAQTSDGKQQEVLATHTITSVVEADSGSLILDTIGTGGHMMTPTQVAKALSQGQQYVIDEKKLIAGQQHENIKAILSPEFLAHDIQAMTETYLKGDMRNYMVAYTNLYNKIDQIYLIMGMSISQELNDARHTGSLKVMITAIENLLHQMDTRFYIAQSHSTRLKKILGWLYALGDKDFGSMSDTVLSGNDLLGTLDFTDYKDLTN